MTRSDLPDQWHDLIAGYALGNLTPAEQMQLNRLLKRHPELEQELRAYEATLAQLPQALPAQMPPAGLEDKILQQLHTSVAPSPQMQEPGSIPLRLRYGWGLGAAIAAGLLLFIGWDNYRLRRSLSASQQNLMLANQDLTLANQMIQQLQQNQQQTEAVLTSLRIPNKAVYSLQGIGELATASGSVVTLMEENKAILIPHNLPTLPPEQVYRFWAAIETDTSEAVLYCGEFNTNENNTVQWALPEAGCGTPAKQVLITVDAVTASTESGGELVMQSLPSQG
ncbi:MAG: anti-sigma factor [Cyanobacteria bacterium J06639_14]